MTRETTAIRLREKTLALEGRTILQNLDLAIASGEKVALLGESGSGKTTLLRSLRQREANQVAWCPQHSGLVPMLSVFHNIYMGRLDRYSASYNLLNLIRPQAGRKAEITRLAEHLGLAERLWHSVDRLSGGQQSRVNLGRALYQERPIFLGDEPVSAVDEHQAHELTRFICERHETVVLALHNIDLALTHCERVIGLKNGRVVLDERCDNLKPAALYELYPTAA